MLPSRSRPLLLLLLMALSLACFALAACGGGGGSPSSGKSDDEKRLAFEDCLREHGLDVQTAADGRTAIRMTARGGGGNGPTSQSSGDPNDPNGPFAICRRQTGWAPTPPSAAEQAEMRDRALRTARCMRSHGVDMPDPAPDGRMLMRVPDNSPTFQAAARACGLGVADAPPPGKGGEGGGGNFSVSP